MVSIGNNGPRCPGCYIFGSGSVKEVSHFQDWRYLYLSILHICKSIVFVFLAECYGTPNSFEGFQFLSHTEYTC